MTIAKESGDYLVNIARKTISHYFETNEKLPIPDDCPEELKENLGVFVTLNENKELRGCIGYPEPVVPAIEATINVALSAAFEDPRFNPVTQEEFNNIDIEVTVLTKPELIIASNPKEILDQIRIGTDGLIVEKGFFRGLLLPQVAPENNMDEIEFISHTCLKAGIHPKSWVEQDCKIYRFQGQIFSSD